MKSLFRPQTKLVLWVLLGLAPRESNALSLTEFRKFSPGEQSMIVTASVNMLIYSYASEGRLERAKCVRRWYFGQTGLKAPGPAEIVNQAALAERRDSSKFEIEGVILGSAERACPAKAPN